MDRTAPLAVALSNRQQHRRRSGGAFVLILLAITVRRVMVDRAPFVSGATPAIEES